MTGYLNNHTTRWGYKQTSPRENEEEDCQIDISLILLNDPEDSLTFLFRRWIATSILDMAFVPKDLFRQKKILAKY